MRISQHGRFGLDHCESLNYHISETNKKHIDHINWLTYGSKDKPQETLSSFLFTNVPCNEDGKVKKVRPSSGKALSYEEWSKRKDA